ncbi:MAG: ribokinase [Microbacteriaceae bacterium]|nr:ribokinase [Microbacteriaceae bacterium]
MAARVTVVGSANMDVVFVVDRIPGPGETLLAESASRFPGGKGLNQAVAAARAGSQTGFIGALGADGNGDALRGAMVESGISTDRVRTELLDTGQAFIVVNSAGENTIIVAAGANATVGSIDDGDRAEIAGSGVLLMQLEIPVEAVAEAARSARAAGVLVMLNAAPARSLADDLLGNLDYLIVNEHEACIIGGSTDLNTAAVALAARVPRLVVTLGAKGSVLYEHGAEFARVAAPKVDAVDSTGAGDTYCGAFASAIADGLGYGQAATFATAAAALSVGQLGAVPSIPLRSAIDAARAEWGMA